MKNFALIIVFYFGAHYYVSASNPLKLAVLVKEISCFGKQDGEIELILSGGKQPYVVTWTDGVNETKRSNLSKGKYACVVTDAKGNKVESEILLVPPSPLSVQFSQFDNCLITKHGEMDIAIDGGTPFEGNWDQRFNVSIIEKFNERNSRFENKLLVVDKNNCSLTFPVEISLIDSDDCFSRQIVASPNPKAIIQVRVERSDKTDFSLLK
jgi:hypothetical protein